MQERKRQLIFILIGLGCGIVLSGILGLVLLLNTIEYKSGIISSKQVAIQSKELITDNMEANQESIPEEKATSSAAIKVTEDTTVAKTEVKVNPSNVVSKNKEVTVVIPDNLTASETCEILEESGIVDDAKAFRAYLGSKKMTTKLNEGTFILRENMPYHEVLEKLMVN